MLLTSTPSRTVSETVNSELTKAFLKLLPVSTLDGAETAADLLASALRTRRRVLVVGDFDADGATSTALMMRQFTALGFEQPDFLVPDRFRFGYGLTPEIVRVAVERKPGLISRWLQAA